MKNNWLQNNNSFHVVLVFSNSGDLVVKEALFRIYELGSKFKVFDIHVVSPISRPYYLKFLREVIQNIIAFSLRIWYNGSSVEDLRKLINDLASRKDRAIFVVEKDMPEYYGLIRSFNFETIVVGE